MSAKKIIYDMLTASQELDAMLARSSIPGAEQLPAIYDVWPGEDAPMPYILAMWRFPPGEHWAQVAANLKLHIYVDSGDTTEAEAIKNLCLKLLAWERVQTEEEGVLSVYFGSIDEELPEPEPEVVHWTVDFLVKYWRQGLIRAVTSNE